MQGFWRTNLTIYLLDLLGNAVVSAVGTTLFHSPGCNEGEARNETLGPHRQKQNELRRSGTNRASICLGQNSAAPLQDLFIFIT